VLVVGAGTIARHKAESLLGCGAVVTVVAPSVSEAVREMAEQGRLRLHERPFRGEDVDGKRLVIAATSDAVVNEVVMQRCRALGVLVNVVDDPSRCDFHVPAVVERGGVQVAISTGGASPALSRRLKEEIGSVLEPTLGAYAELVAEARDRIKRLLSDREYEDRRLANEAVLASDARRLLAAGDEEGARRVVWELLDTMQGRKAEE
jgi:siroheme synthase-like protein